MSFNILIHDDISLDELIKINESGGRVLKTPHIGNIYPNNLAIISLGIPTLLYDRTIGTKDENFHPYKLRLTGNILTMNFLAILNVANERLTPYRFCPNFVSYKSGTDKQKSNQNKGYHSLGKFHIPNINQQ